MELLKFIVCCLCVLPLYSCSAFPYEPAIVRLSGKVTESFGPELVLLDELEINVRLLEEQIPELAVKALRKAYCDARASGYSILVAREDSLVELHPDGSETFVKTLQPSAPFASSLKLQLDSVPGTLVLVLDNPIDVGSEFDLTNIFERDVCEIQIVFSENCQPINDFDTDVTLVGTLVNGQKNGYVRRVCMLVEKWEKIH